MIELRQGFKEAVAGDAYFRRVVVFHSMFNGFVSAGSGICGGRTRVPVRSLSWNRLSFSLRGGASGT